MKSRTTISADTTTCPSCKKKDTLESNSEYVSVTEAYYLPFEIKGEIHHHDENIIRSSRVCNYCKEKFSARWVNPCPVPGCGWPTKNPNATITGKLVTTRKQEVDDALINQQDFEQEFLGM